MFSTSNVKEALKIDVAVSPLMVDALQLWSLMYQNEASWINSEVKSMGLPASISGEIARMVTVEMSVEIKGSPRADFLNSQLQKVIQHLKNQKVEYAVAKGSMMFKPYPKNGKIAVDFVPADSFYPVAFDENANITACVFVDQRKMGQYWYTRLEYHQMDVTSCLIRNVAYKSSTENMLGSPVPLAEVTDWAQLVPEATIMNITAPLYGYFRYPSSNNVDPHSPLGVSCFSHAQDPTGNVKLIQQADELFSNLVWEFDSGKRAVYVDELAFDQDDDGKPRVPNKRLYRTLKNLSQIGKESKLFEDWSPEFREAAIKSGLDAVLKKIEFACRLAYGTISDPQTVDKTATEIIASQQRSYVTVTSTQLALQDAVNQLIYAMDVWCTLFGFEKPGAYQTTYRFDDSVITDKDAQFSKDSQVVGMGAMPKVVFLMRNYGLSEATAKEWLTKTQAEQPDDLFANAEEE